MYRVFVAAQGPPLPRPSRAKYSRCRREFAPGPAPVSLARWCEWAVAGRTPPSVEWLLQRFEPPAIAAAFRRIYRCSPLQARDNRRLRGYSCSALERIAADLGWAGAK